MVKNAVMVSGTVLAIALVQMVVYAANSDSGAGWLHLGMLWLSGAITMYVARLMFTE